MRTHVQSEMKLTVLARSAIHVVYTHVTERVTSRAQYDFIRMHIERVATRKKKTCIVSRWRVKVGRGVSKFR